MPPPCCDYVKSKDYAAHLQYQRLFQFLMGLNDGYAPARSQIIMKTNIPNVNQAYAMILQDESLKIVAGGGGMNATALFTARNTGSKPKKNYGVKCEFCHVRGHTKSQCFKLIKCSHCHFTGHLKENCYKLISYPPDVKSKRKDFPASGNIVQDEGNLHALISIPPISTPLTAPMFTAEQYAQILGMLNNDADHQASANLTGTSLHAF